MSAEKSHQSGLTFILLVILIVVGGVYWVKHTQAVAEQTAAVAALPAAGYDWSLMTLDGRIVPFSTFKGKTVFLNFWATWCGPCREEMPSIERMYQKLQGKGIEVVVASWEDPDVVRNYLQNQHFTFPVYTFVAPAPASYKSDGIPVTFVLSPQGKVVLNHIDPGNWDDDDFIKFLLSVGH